MESPPMQRRYPIVERPLSPRDYDMPVGWWGWNWEPPVPMSITQILEAGNMDARTAALCGMAIESHGSLLIAAEQPHSGKTTTLTALLDFLPNATRRIFIRGWAETFDFLGQTRPDSTLLLANELSSHLPVYLWGPKAVRVFETLRRGYALGSTLHADTADEAVAQLTVELVASRRGEDIDTAAAELERRTEFLCDLLQQRRREIPDVRAALAEYRGERTPIDMRGDPTV